MDEIRQASKRLRIVRERDEAEYRRITNKLDREEGRIEERYDALEEKRGRLADANGSPNAARDDVVEINAGGRTIDVKRGTLCRAAGTGLDALFGGRWERRLQRDAAGRIFLDVNPAAFQAVVDYLNEMAISPADDPPQHPAVEDENQYLVDHLLQLLVAEQFDWTNVNAVEFDSNIVNQPNYVGLLHDWLEEDASDGDLRLLYRSSRDGKAAYDFHSRCDGGGSTLTVVETIDGLILGGYSNTPWGTTSAWLSADRAFLFALSGNGISSPCKMRLKDRGDQMATYHSHFCGPAFADFRVSGSYLLLSVSSQSFDLGPVEQIFGIRRHTIKEVEVFQVDETQTQVKPAAISQENDQCEDVAPMKIQETTSFTNEINGALNAKLRMIKEAEQKIIFLENQLEEEEKFIELFASGDTKDVVNLNVSGTLMATKRSTLMLFEESVLARQFDDSRWTEQGQSTRRVKDWTPSDVFFWVQSIDDISDDVANIFVENQITGNELLALEKDGLVMMGIKRTGTLCLLSKEIKRLEESSSDIVTLIEHSPYCFGKILDYLRLKRLHSHGLVDVPELPSVRESDRCRFERVVKYFFPGDGAELILGAATPITIKMAKNAQVPDGGDKGRDFLKDGRPLHTVVLVAAVRSHEETSAEEFMVDVEDGTGYMQVEVMLNKHNDYGSEVQSLPELCKDGTYVRIVGQVEDFGGQRRILAEDLRPVSGGNELTDHLLGVASSYDKYLQAQRQQMRMRMSDILQNVDPNRSPQGRPLRRGNGGVGVGALNDTVLWCVQTMGAYSDSGAHVSDIIAVMSPQGFSADEIRNAIRYASNEGYIYSTIDENHWQHAV